MAKVATYRCSACSTFLCFGPVSSADLRTKKYRHDRDECPSYDGAPLHATTTLFFDDATWRSDHVGVVANEKSLEKTVLVGPAVPK